MKIALIGNQNSGKTTLFNNLTGMNQKIGNWPGVTIEKKVGRIKGTNHELIDLPGIYSLTPYTIEEKISRDFIIENKIDLIINIVDATSLERSLYLTTELLDLDVQVVIAVNMIDRLNAKGISINTEKLKERLGVEVCEISALKGKGIDNLIKKISMISIQKNNQIKIFPRDVEETIYNIQNRIESIKHKRYMALEVLKNSNLNSIKILQEKIQKNYNMDIEETLITLRYEYISRIKNECITKIKNTKNISRTLDKIFLNKFLAIPIFAVIMFFIYYLSVGLVGTYTADLVKNSIDGFRIFIQELLEAINLSNWIISLICDGIITGVGSVLSFLPQLCMLFLSISLLEATGYMSRIAFLLDKLFRKLGLSGKALIPFIVGSGCSVPGIMASRIMEDQYDRKVVTILTPLVPCSAKLPIIALFTGYFFKENYGIIATSFYLLAIVIIIISSLLMKKLLHKKYTSTYISELPEYKIPTIKYVLREVWDRVKEFIKKAGTLIFVSSIVVWFLLSFSIDLKYGGEIENSILAFIGKKIAWIFYPIIGVNSWEVSVSALQGLIAKEQVVSSMEIISGLSKDLKVPFEIFGNGSPFEFFNKASSYAFVVFNLFSAPCFAAISTMKKELGNIKQTIFAILFQTSIAWCLSLILYNLLKVIL